MENTPLIWGLFDAPKINWKSVPRSVSKTKALRNSCFIRFIRLDPRSNNDGLS